MIIYLADIKKDNDGVNTISFVANAANKTQFTNPCKSGLCSLSENNEVVGLVLRPNQKILRMTDEGEPYVMYFNESSVKRSAESFSKNLALKSSNIEHDADQKTSGVTFTETWIVEDPNNDKANTYGFKAKKGEWYVKAKVEDKAVLEALKSGEVTGLSLEGFFSLKPIAQVLEQTEEIFNVINF